MRITNKKLMALGFGGGIGIVSIVTLSIAYFYSIESTLTLMHDKARLVVDTTVTLITKDFTPINKQALGLQTALQTGTTTPEQLETSLHLLQPATDAADIIALIRPNGRFVAYDGNQKEYTKGDLSEKKQVMRTLEQTGRQTTSRWVAPMFSEGVGETIFTYQTPLQVQGKYWGVLAHLVNLRTLSKMLQENSGAGGHTPFILYKKDYVLAHPAYTRNQVVTSTDSPLPFIGGFPDPVLSRYLDSTEFKGGIFNENMKNMKTSRVRIDGKAYIFLTKQQIIEGFGELTVGVYFDASTETAALHQLLNSIWIVAVFVLLAVLLTIPLANIFSRPALNLARAARQVLNGDLASVSELPPSSIVEMDQASTAFNKMVAGLKEAEHIRSIFGRMVPRKIAEKMLNSPDGLEPQSAVATVLFSDLVGFTSISEKIPPNEIVSLLNAYFQEMVEIIEKHDGIITQFQGDGILAVFGIPLDDARQADKAIMAAQEMSQAVLNNKYAGHKLDCRIGINTGHLVAGNVGAKNRMNYTVNGDAVNVAARLEQMNKIYATRILVAGATIEMASGINAEKIGSADVRGKQQMIEVYTL